MTKKEFRQLVQSRIVVLDGATGSNLQANGMPMGVCPEQWVLENRDVLIELQMEYIKSGVDVLYAPTFTANRIKLAEYGLEETIQDMNAKLVQLSKEAIKRSGTDRAVYIAGDLTMTGQQLYPMGTLTFEQLVEVYREQAMYLILEGIDLFVIETMMSLNECRAALIAIREICDLPVMVTLTFNEDKRTLYGTDPKTAILVLQSMGADAVGVNCSTGPDQMAEVVYEMKQIATVPVIAKPNAGLPKLINGVTVYDMGSEEFSKATAALCKAGASIVGGCCGTTPKHMKLLVERVQMETVPEIQKRSIRALTTERSTLEFTLNGPFMVIGERINPTGKKELQAQLREGRFELVREMAEEQAQKGAAILDVNMGMNGIDEKETMVQAIYEIIKSVNLPLCIDSSHVDVIEAALRIYPGRALINSISLEPEKFERLIPLAKKYGAMFILLPLSEKGLPKNIEEKKSIIDTIVSRAYEEGLCKEDIIVDGLVNTIGANKKAAMETLETIRYCKEELGLLTACGLSNISFGLPQRQFVNSTFLAFAIKEGLTMAIANPSQELLMCTAFASDLLLNKSEADLRYIHQVSTVTMEVKSETTDADKKEEKDSHILFDAVVKGKEKEIVSLVKVAIQNGDLPHHILNERLIPAINHVGNLFDQQIYFLPQLIASAQTMETAIQYLEPLLKQDASQKKLGTIVIATVAGDIHDIGKNLVALMLKNHGFDVIDLGKDVKTMDIIEKAKEVDADIIALSALMTTTMMEMKEVIKEKQKFNLRAKVIIGGAVITQSFADEIGADGYSKDAADAVRLVKTLLNI